MPGVNRDNPQPPYPAVTNAPTERERRLEACLRAYVTACHEQGINLGPITGDAEAVLSEEKR
jgi:hypothetical protein